MAITTNNKITSEQLKAAFHYDNATGIFTWNFRPAAFIKVGQQAGCICKTNGYVILCLNYQHFYAHRLAWFYVTGKWPQKEIDHKNGIKDDNRFENLREVSSLENKQNLRKLRAHQAIKLMGVVKHGTKFSARIRYGGKKVSLGSFVTPELAHEAYMKAKRAFHPGYVEL